MSVGRLLYRTSLFSKMASNLSSLRGRRVLLFLDFDGTITKKDTMHLVAQVGYTQPAAVELPPWDHFVDSYMNDFKSHVQKYRPEKEQRKTIDQEVSWLQSLQPIEEASAARVRASGLFDVENPAVAIGKVIDKEHHDTATRPGLRQLLHEFQATSQSWRSIESRNASLDGINSTFCHIISVNWSRKWIMAVMRSTSGDDAPIWKFDEGENGLVKVYANEVFGHVGENTADAIQPETATKEKLSDENGYAIPCRTSKDKVSQMRHILEEFAQHNLSAGQTDEGRPVAVYFGDSSTDLECLIEADIGICIRDEPLGSGQKELAESCQRIGIDVLHISELRQAQRRQDVLYWVRDYVDFWDQWHKL